MAFQRRRSLLSLLGQSGRQFTASNPAPPSWYHLLRHSTCARSFSSGGGAQRRAGGANNKRPQLHCAGCGVPLQSHSEGGVGFVPRTVRDRAAVPAESIPDKPAEGAAAANANAAWWLGQQSEAAAAPTAHVICQRCYQAKHSGSFVPSDVSSADFSAYLDQLRQQNCVLLAVADVFDFEGTLLQNLRDGLHPRSDAILVVNKCDLLPKATKFRRVHDWVRAALKRMGMQGVFKRVLLLSGRSGSGVEDMIEAVEEVRRGRDIYAVGPANVGKSTLINRFVHDRWTVPKLQAAGLTGTKLKRKDTFGVILGHLPPGYKEGDTFLGSNEELREASVDSGSLADQVDSEVADDGTPFPRYLVRDASGRGGLLPEEVLRAARRRRWSGREHDPGDGEGPQLADGLNEHRSEDFDLLRAGAGLPGLRSAEADASPEAELGRAAKMLVAAGLAPDNPALSIVDGPQTERDFLSGGLEVVGDGVEEAVAEAAVRVVSGAGGGAISGETDWKGAIKVGGAASFGSAERPHRALLGAQQRLRMPDELRPVFFPRAAAAAVGRGDAQAGGVSAHDDALRAIDALAAEADEADAVGAALRDSAAEALLSAVPLTTSPLPGTTLGVVGVPWARDGGRLYDTPGIVLDPTKQSLLEQLARQPDGARALRELHPTKRLRPRHYRVRSGRSLFLGGLARVDFRHPDPNAAILLTVFGSVPGHLTRQAVADRLLQRHAGLRRTRLWPALGRGWQAQVDDGLLPAPESQRELGASDEGEWVPFMLPEAPVGATVPPSLVERAPVRLAAYCPELGRSAPANRGKTRHKRVHRLRRAVLDLCIGGIGWVAVTPIEIEGTPMWDRLVREAEVGVAGAEGVRFRTRPPLLPFEAAGSRPRDWVDR